MPDNAAVQEGLGTEFEIVRELGRGGASVVYLARDRMLGREVAIKVIDDRYAGDAEALARFQREARLLAGLQHPNIVPVHAARRLPDGRVALVMQHMAGATLRELLRREGPLSFERVERTLCDVGEALAYLHRRGVVHRDVKPENIYLEPDGSRAFLSDFGIAKPADADSGLTLSGVVLGTPTYMSPEQIDGGWLNGQSDVYSLGLVGWEMLTGARPWAGESLYTVIYKQKHESLPPLHELRPDVPERLREAVERALVKDRALRWPGAEAFVQQLRGASLPARVDTAAAVPAAPPLAGGAAEEDALTQVIRPAEVAGVWQEAAGRVERRTQTRRRRTAAAAVGVVLSLGGLTAAAAVFAKMGGGDPFASFDTAPAAAPAPARPAVAPTAVPREAVAPTVLPAADSAIGVVPASTPGGASAGSAAPAPRETVREGAGQTAGTPRRARPRRRPTSPAPAPARRTGSRAPAPAASTPAPAPAEEAQQPVLGEPRLLGTPVNQTVRTRPAQTLGEPRVTGAAAPGSRPQR